MIFLSFANCRHHQMTSIHRHRAEIDYFNFKKILKQYLSRAQLLWLERGTKLHIIFVLVIAKHPGAACRLARVWKGAEHWHVRVEQRPRRWVALGGAFVLGARVVCQCVWVVVRRIEKKEKFSPSKYVPSTGSKPLTMSESQQIAAASKGMGSARARARTAQNFMFLFNLVYTRNLVTCSKSSPFYSGQILTLLCQASTPAWKKYYVDTVLRFWWLSQNCIIKRIWPWFDFEINVRFKSRLQVLLPLQPFTMIEQSAKILRISDLQMASTGEIRCLSGIFNRV